MTQRIRFKWLHRVGYVTTLIVIAEIIGLITLFGSLWWADRDQRAYEMELTRTHQGPIVAQQSRYRPDELDLLLTLPSLKTFDSDGMRFVAMPSLRDPWFAVSLAILPQSPRSQGVIVIFDHPNYVEGSLIPNREIKFSMPASQAKTLLSKMNRMTENWDGERGLCVDGTSVSFELISDGEIMSGSGNAACSEHYGKLSQLVLNSIRKIIPVDSRPNGRDWRPKNDFSMEILSSN